jgi:hypothetical protein
MKPVTDITEQNNVITSEVFPNLFSFLADILRFVKNLEYILCMGPKEEKEETGRNIKQQVS